MRQIVPNYFRKFSSFKFEFRSLFIFFVSAFIAWEINILGQITFPSYNLVPYCIRTTITLISDLALLYISYYLLKRNKLSPLALGLRLSKRTLINLLIGVAIGVITILTVACLLYFLVPYHFVYKSTNGVKILMESYSYLLGNSLEELIFRGFLLIILSQVTSWRLSLLIMALPFGLFHLQGAGFNYSGFSIVASTTIYSFIFGLSFILTRSMWTAIAAHISGNIFLHLLTGLDGAGRSVYSPVFEKNWPKNYDAGLLTSIVSAITISTLLYLSILRKDKKNLRN
jgi:membrane protease YdiL (CAAX protease family)